jgi:hypothetical protein
LIGREAPIFRIVLSRHPFFEFYFFNLFLKKFLADPRLFWAREQLELKLAHISSYRQLECTVHGLFGKVARPETNDISNAQHSTWRYETEKLV